MKTTPLQLITDVQVEPNQADDAELMEQSLDGQAERDINVEKVTTDGGYTGPKGEKACEKHNVELRATRMRGGTCYSNQFGWEQYDWEINDEDGTLRELTCPEGCRATVEPGRVDGKYIVRFEAERCKTCPFFKEKCRVQDRARVGPTIYINQIVVDAARRRQQLHPEDTPVRVVVESTIRSLKRAFPGSKLPVRGLIRSRMMLYLAPLMVNVRRLHDYLSEKEGKKAQKGRFSLPFFKMDLFRGLKHAFCHFLKMLSVFWLQPVSVLFR